MPVCHVAMLSRPRAYCFPHLSFASSRFVSWLLRAPYAVRLLEICYVNERFRVCFAVLSAFRLVPAAGFVPDGECTMPRTCTDVNRFFYVSCIFFYSVMI